MALTDAHAATKSADAKNKPTPRFGGASNKEDAMKTLAALTNGKYIVGYAYTSAKNGETVSYGHELPGGPIHQIGRAKISRNKRHLKNIEKEFEQFDVNCGGGEAL